MYLSKLELNLRNATVRRDLADAYDMHRSLTRGFVSGTNEHPPRFLWRVEPESKWANPVVLVQSRTSPDWSCFSVRGYLQKEPGIKNVDTTKLVQEGYRYRFRLFGNTVLTRQGKRYGLSSEEDQIEWLKRKGARCGFDIDNVLVTSSDIIYLRGNDICLRQTCFEGILTPNDAPNLQNALVNGVGPAKSFGLGLLSLSPR